MDADEEGTENRVTFVNDLYASKMALTPAKRSTAPDHALEDYEEPMSSSSLYDMGQETVEVKDVDSSVLATVVCFWFISLIHNRSHIRIG